jgi:hypothetical protein
MDCEKYEPLLLDELYEELDELTSAAVKRHVSGCARCNGILQGMRATRRAAVLPILAPPADLEERILAAAREAQKVVPLRGRLASVVSRAGSWAMRPQTAMAAVFLLVIGASPFLIRSGRQASPSAVSVVVAGEPSPMAAAPAASGDSLSGPAAAAAHGAGAATTYPPTGAGAGGDVLARGASAAGAAGAKRAKDDFGGEANDERDDEAKRFAGASNAGVPAGAPAAGFVGAATNKGGADVAEGSGDAFSAGMAAWRLRSFAEAQRHFETAAATGDVNAALWAAKAMREGKDGPAMALGRFDAIAQRAPGTYQGAEAQLEAARCEITLGQLDGARARLKRLSGVSSHAAVAQKELEQVDQIAARRAAGAAGRGGSTGGGLAAPKAAARAPAAAATQAAEQAAPAKASDVSPRAGSGY